MISINYKLSVIVLECDSNESDVCGANGLPITPSSIAMFGNFKSFIDSNNNSNNCCIYLTKYLDCIRNKKEKISLIFEHYLNSLPINDFERLALNSLQALYHLHYVMGCIHGLITPEAFVFDGNVVKLTHWALNPINNCGKYSSAHIIIPNDIRFLSFEQLFGITTVRKSDVWSLALSLLTFIEPNIKLPQNPIEIINSNDSKEVLNKLNVKLENLSQKWQNFFLSALNPKATKRATVRQLFKILEIQTPELECQQLNTFLRFPKLDNSYKRETISINEFYHLWCLAFPQRDNNEEKKQKRPPILSLPSLVLRDENNSNSETVKRKKYIQIPANNELKLLPIDKLMNRLNRLPEHIFCPLILSPGFNSVWVSPNLPIVIRENDFDYQFERIMIFKRLIEGSPFLRPELLSCAKVDIPPLYRSHIWSSILSVKWSDLLVYETIDKITSTPTDRQISVDIPRCHQYNDLLASPEGHIKLTRILKAWLRHNESKGDVYWQGLDSLAAPFVIINFNNESQAFASFNAFIHKYLKGFFQRDNSCVIQEYLALFSILISFQDPVLANHLNSLSFVPDLYAIPWFLTMFTHVLPLHQIMHLWDTLLLGNESFPLFIGLSILHQLRDQLLNFTFNDCILIFSDLPQIDIDKCVKHAIKLFCATPKSVSQRGFWPLEALKSETIARIDVNDVVSLVNSEKSKVVIIDGRNKEEITRFGSIRNAIVSDDFEVITNGHIIIVVNDIEKGLQLIKSNSLRVCLLLLNSYVPNQLLD